MNIIKVIVIAGLALLFVFWMRLRKRKNSQKEDKEQVDRKIQEDALDRALSNHSHYSRSPQVQAPFSVQYNGEESGKKGVEMLRLIERSESITKKYLARRDCVVFLGEEYGHPAVFRQYDKKNIIYCEIFPNDGNTYIRCCGKVKSVLIRGKKKTVIDADGIRVRSGDMVDMRCGTFLLEFL